MKPSALVYNIIFLGMSLIPLQIQAQEGYEGKTFRGFHEINNIVFERILNEAPHLGHYLNEKSILFYPIYSVLSLMGYQDVTKVGSPMVNGAPNSINTLLYHMLFDQFTKEIASHCPVLHEPIPFNDYNIDFLPNLKHLCFAPLNSPLSDDFLAQLWVQVMSYDAPQSEYESWKLYIKSLEPDSVEERIHQYLYPIFMNPFFLLSP